MITPNVQGPKQIFILDQMTPPSKPAYPGMEQSWNDCGQGGVEFPGGAKTLEWWEGGWHGSQETPDLALVEKSFSAYPHGRRVSIDIEGKHIHDLRIASREVVDASIKLMLSVINAAKKARPDLQIGLYATIPCDYWSAVQYEEALQAEKKKREGQPLNSRDLWLIHMMPTFEKGMADWQAACEHCKDLINAVDFIELDCYARYNAVDGPNDPKDIKSDAAFIKHNVAMAKRLSGGKPIFATISNQIFEPDAQPLLSIARFKALCLALRNAGINGVIVWNWTQNQPLNPHQRACCKIAVEVFGPKKVDQIQHPAK